MLSITADEIDDVVNRLDVRGMGSCRTQLHRLVGVLFVDFRHRHAERNREQGQRYQADGAYADKQAYGKYSLYHCFAAGCRVSSGLLGCFAI